VVLELLAGRQDLRAEDVKRSAVVVVAVLARPEDWHAAHVARVENLDDLRPEVRVFVVRLVDRERSLPDLQEAE
jgi:hypothetical protein